MPPSRIAAVIVVRTVPDPTVEDPGRGRMELVGRDCTTVEDALAALGEALATLDEWQIASLVPGATVAELQAQERI